MIAAARTDQHCRSSIVRLRRLINRQCGLGYIGNQRGRSNDRRFENAGVLLTRNVAVWLSLPQRAFLTAAFVILFVNAGISRRGSWPDVDDKGICRACLMCHVDLRGRNKSVTDDNVTRLFGKAS